MADKRLQRLKHSLIEQLVHTVMGFVITMICIYLFFPEIHFITNIKATAMMTGIKFICHFGVRRLFTHHTHRVLEERRRSGKTKL